MREINAKGKLHTLPDLVGYHYKLDSYICGKACILPAPDDHLRSFTQIFNNRPDGCRYAIAQMAPLFLDPDCKDPNKPIFVTGEPRGPWLVWDLLEEQLVRGMRNGPNATVSPPPPLYMGETADGMAMKAMALFDG